MTRKRREQQTLVQNPKLSPCPVEALAREHKRLADLHVRSAPTSGPDSLHDLAGERMSAVEDAAFAMRAASPGGALFQITAIMAAIDDLDAHEDADRIVLRRARSAVFSIASVLETLSGEDRSAFSGDYAIPSENDPHIVAARLPSVTNS
jgi:hypothetical protein